MTSKVSKVGDRPAKRNRAATIVPGSGWNDVEAARECEMPVPERSTNRSRLCTKCALFRYRRDKRASRGVASSTAGGVSENAALGQTGRCSRDKFSLFESRLNRV